MSETLPSFIERANIIMATALTATTIRMSSIEIAKILQKEHQGVFDDITTLLATVGLNRNQFLSGIGESREYLLPKAEAITFVAHHDPRFLHSVMTSLEKIESEQLGLTMSEMEMIAVIAARASEAERRQIVFERNQDAILKQQHELDERVTRIEEAGLPPSGYDCLARFSATIGITTKKLKVIFHICNVDTREYRYSTPTGIPVRTTAYHEEQAREAVAKVLSEAIQVTKHYLEHPKVGRFKYVTDYTK